MYKFYMKKKFNIFLNKIEAATAFTSAGICFYTDKKILLLKKQNNKYEFLGGKTDNRDKSLFITAIREAQEESNNLILGYREPCQEKIIKYILDTNKDYVYWYPNKEYRFGLFFIKLEEHMEKNPQFYGNREIYEDIERTLDWISINRINEIIDKKRNLNFENDCFIFDNLHKIINNPESCDFLHKWYL